MNANERRKQIIRLLSDSNAPIPGISLAKDLGVSRQVIVQDIALLRAEGNDILSMKQGYLMQQKSSLKRVFKTFHSENEVEEELQLIVDLGGFIKDVFVYHKVYGVIKAEMNIKSRLDIEKFMADIRSGKSVPLLRVTSGYHYHTVLADSEQLLDVIQEKLAQRGFLASLQDHEPVEFPVRAEM